MDMSAPLTMIFGFFFCTNLFLYTVILNVYFMLMNAYCTCVFCDLTFTSTVLNIIYYNIILVENTCIYIYSENRM